MKQILLIVTMTALLAYPALAQPDCTNAPLSHPGGPFGPGGHFMDFLTDAQQTELKKAHAAAIAADPTLATDEAQIHEDMMAAHESGTPPTDDQIAAFMAFREKLDAAMIKADPAVAPLIEEIKKHHPGGPGGFGGPPPSSP